MRGYCCRVCMGVFCLLVLKTFVWAEKVHLTIMSLADKTHEYYVELLTSALEADQHDVSIAFVPSAPQKRIVKMLEQNKISLHWFIRTDERDRIFVPIDCQLTNGLIGKRVLFIPKGKQAEYQSVNTLDDFRQLGKVGAFGKNWYDVKVWQANRLRYTEKDGDWRAIYRMLPIRENMDYFSRGANEIIEEAAFHPYLEIEKRLILEYDRDFCFYLSQSAKKYKDVIEKALKKAVASGRLEHLVKKYWSRVYTELDLENRIVLKLRSP